MIQHVKAVAGFFFYLLGVSFFAAYLLSFNMLGGLWPQWWMNVADLPLATAACLYGGTSLYLSIVRPEKHSRIAAALIGIPLLAVLVFFFVLNFWDIL